MEFTEENMQVVDVEDVGRATAWDTPMSARSAAESTGIASPTGAF